MATADALSGLIQDWPYAPSLGFNQNTILYRRQTWELCTAWRRSSVSRCANIRQAMKIKDKDGRVFQDGLYDAE